LSLSECLSRFLNVAKAIDEGLGRKIPQLVLLALRGGLSWCRRDLQITHFTSRSNFQSSPAVQRNAHYVHWASAHVGQHTSPFSGVGGKNDRLICGAHFAIALREFAGSIGDSADDLAANFRRLTGKQSAKCGRYVLAHAGKVFRRIEFERHWYSLDLDFLKAGLLECFTKY
jgi:hypothetical protein